uniref:Uncharacterized protein n=2 Tax=viral metagenome TaxID=1070528 RepID=A0A6M3LTQ5_9ZZZZ
MVKNKKLSEESDLTILNEYDKITLIPSIKEIIFFVFMIFLWRSENYWFFWILVGLALFVTIYILFDGIVPKRTLIKEELKRRGYSNKWKNLN